MRFDNINELRKKYELKASFYKKGDLLCRNYADIIKKDYIDDKINAYIIMINPGSCEPINQEVYKNAISATSPNTAIYVDAKIDKAQKRVMQLMDNMEYNKVRILNLFDYKESKLNKAAEMAVENNNYSISIFSTERKSELQTLTKSDSPFIVCYGLNGLDDYKKMALEFLLDKKVYGIKKDNNDLKYYYLSPPVNAKAEKIITDIVSQLKGN